MTNEIAARREVYKYIYYDQIDAGIKRITWRGGAYTDPHWMICAQDLFPIAQIFNAVVILVGLEAGEAFIRVSLYLLGNPDQLQPVG